MRRFIFIFLTVSLLFSALPGAADAEGADGAAYPPALVENLSQAENISITDQGLSFRVSSVDDEFVRGRTEASFGLCNLERTAIYCDLAVRLKLVPDELENICPEASVDGAGMTTAFYYAGNEAGISKSRIQSEFFSPDTEISVCLYEITPESDILYIQLELIYDPEKTCVFVEGFDDYLPLSAGKCRLSTRLSDAASLSVAYIGAPPLIRMAAYSDKTMREMSSDYTVARTTDTIAFQQWLSQLYKKSGALGAVQEYNHRASVVSEMLLASARRILQTEDILDRLDEAADFYLVVQTRLEPLAKRAVVISMNIASAADRSRTVQAVYGLEYMFSRDTLWHSDRGIEVSVDSPLYISASNLLFEKNASGLYSAYVTSKNENLLSFTLCSVEKPDVRQSEILSAIMDVMLIAVPVLFALTALLLLAAFVIGKGPFSRKRKK